MIYRISYKGHLSSGQPWMTGFHIHTAPPAGGGEPAIADILSTWDTHVFTALRACINTNVVIESGEIRSVPDPNGQDVPAASSITKNANGTLANGTGLLPDGVAIILQLKSSAASRSGRGYMALPSPNYSSYLGSANAWGTGITTPVNAFGALLKDVLHIGSVLITDTSAVVYSRTRALRAESPNEWDIQSALCRVKPAWRRTRMN